VDPAAGALAAVNPTCITSMWVLQWYHPWGHTNHCHGYHGHHSDGNCQYTLDLPPGLRGRGPSELFSSWSTFDSHFCLFLRQPFLFPIMADNQPRGLQNAIKTTELIDPLEFANEVGDLQISGSNSGKSMQTVKQSNRMTALTRSCLPF
jgi:hypothetical protein